jgi:hypothetical protein
VGNGSTIRIQTTDGNNTITAGNGGGTIMPGNGDDTFGSVHVVNLGSNDSMGALAQDRQESSDDPPRP